MSILVPAARQTNANTAGQTKPAADRTTTQLNAPVANATDDIEGILTGGHSLISIAPLHLAKATDSILGPNGGLIPRQGSVLAPGPAGAAATAGRIQATSRHEITTTVNKARSSWQRLLGRVR